MFSLAYQLVRWSIILMIAAAVTLAALFLSLRYEGAGRFRVQWKRTPGLAGTLTMAGIRPPPADLTVRAPPRAPELTGCARIRAHLDDAVAEYQDRTRLPMTTLDIFALLDAEVLDQLPACPRGGSFQRRGGKVVCSLHR